MEIYKKKYDYEHVTTYIKSSKKFRLINYENKIIYSKLRLTIDHKEDLVLMRKIFNYFSSWFNKSIIHFYIKLIQKFYFKSLQIKKHFFRKKIFNKN